MSLLRDLVANIKSGDGLRKAAITLTKSQYVWGIVAIVLLLAVNLIKDPTYLQITYSADQDRLVGNLIDIMRASAPILMIAVGMCLVIATAGIDLSVGSAMVVAGAVSMEFLNGSAAPESLGAVLSALGLAVVVSAGLGAFNGYLVSVVGLQPFISTLVMMLAGRGLAKVITEGQNTNASSDAFSWIANGYVGGLPVVFMIAVIIAVILALVVRKSALGTMIESIGMDPKASRLAGLNHRALLLTVYTLSGALGGIAGIFATASVMTVDVSRTGYQLELDAILAVVIGGTSLAGGKFSLRGAAVGAVLIATLNKTVVFLGVASSATPAFKAVVIIALALLQSERVRALFTRRERSKTIASAESVSA